MSIPKGGVHLRAARSAELETFRPAYIPEATAPPSVGGTPVLAPPPPSVLYLASPPSSTLRGPVTEKIEAPLSGGFQTSSSGNKPEESTVDWIDVTGWVLMIGGGVAGGFLIDKGLRSDNISLMATGEALASSTFVWGLSETIHRGMGAPHENRWIRLFASVGVGVGTGLAVNYGSMKLDFKVEDHTFQDDKTVATFIPRRERPTILRYLPYINYPVIRIPQAPAPDSKNPTRSWGP